MPKLIVTRTREEMIKELSQMVSCYSLAQLCMFANRVYVNDFKVNEDGLVEEWESDDE